MDKLNLHKISGGGSKVVSDRCWRLIPIQWLHAWSWTLHHQQHYAIKRHTTAALFSKLDIFNNAHSWHFGNQCAMLPLQNTQSNNAKKTPHNKHKNDRLNALIPPVSSCGRQAEESGELPQSPQSSVACTHRMEPHWRRKSRCLFGLE